MTEILERLLWNAISAVKYIYMACNGVSSRYVQPEERMSSEATAEVDIFQVLIKFDITLQCMSYLFYNTEHA